MRLQRTECCFTCRKPLLNYDSLQHTPSWCHLDETHLLFLFLYILIVILVLVSVTIHYYPLICSFSIEKELLNFIKSDSDKHYVLLYITTQSHRLT